MQPTPRLARIYFLSIAFVLLLLSFTLYRQVKDLISSYGAINKTTIVELKLQQILSSLKDAETAQRGFLLTRDSLFLEPYYGAYKSCKNLLSQLHVFISTSSAQAHNLNELTTLVEVRFKTFSSIIHQFNKPGINEETKKNHLLRGKASMDRIQYLINEIIGFEQASMKGKERKRIRHSYMAPMYAFILIITALALLISFYDRTIKQLHRSRRLLKKLRVMNERLKQSNYELKLYNKELDSFIWITSHDLKEPIRKIMTFSSLIKERENSNNPNEYNRKNMATINSSVLRMQKLLDGLLIYYNTTLVIEKAEPLDLNELLLYAELSLSDEIKHNNAILLKEQLPIIIGYPKQVKALFINLLSNSIKFRQEHLPLQITITHCIIDKKDISFSFYKRHNKYNKITLCDNGIGFDEIFKEKVFQIFQRLHNLSSVEGIGVGLTICKKIMQNHHGFINIKSEVGKGTIIECFFPCAIEKKIGNEG